MGGKAKPLGEYVFISVLARNPDTILDHASLSSPKGVTLLHVCTCLWWVRLRIISVQTAVSRIVTFIEVVRWCSGGKLDKGSVSSSRVTANMAFSQRNAQFKIWYTKETRFSISPGILSKTESRHDNRNMTLWNVPWDTPCVWIKRIRDSFQLLSGHVNSNDQSDFPVRVLPNSFP